MTDLLAASKERLKCFHTEAEDMQLSFAVRLVEEKIRNFCHTGRVPDELFNTAVEMVCGEYLRQMLETGGLDPETFPLDSAIASIEEGDVKLSFSNSMSASDRLETLIRHMTESHEAELSGFRRLKW